MAKNTKKADTKRITLDLALHGARTIAIPASTKLTAQEAAAHTLADMARANGLNEKAFRGRVRHVCGIHLNKGDKLTDDHKLVIRAMLLDKTATVVKA